ncbi:hypothetical protein CHS0354_001285 [Potamilus streckersoni]|uniref:Uncharacterized protein n=1 Tax=Potamilus streckersoni TaxID=2493646 RepID=A0AAE0S778_9BIVA|nr:hypothetical protein CHS0354_001285 [Potamilus streckersoni]
MADYADGIYMGNAEYNFFAQIFQIMDKHDRTSDLLERYKAAVAQAVNGIVQWESVSPKFPSYNSILDAAVSTLQSHRILYTKQEFNIIVTLMDKVIQQRERSLALGRTRGDNPVVIQNHEHVVSLWKSMKCRLTQT